MSTSHRLTSGDSPSRWGGAQVMPWLMHLNNDNNAEAVSISCPPTSGSCAAVGTYEAFLSGNGFVVGESQGRWQRVVPTGKVQSSEVSCGAPGSCVAVAGAGYVAEVSGSWQSPRELSSLTTLQGSLTSISCSSAGNCSAVGGYPLQSSGEDGTQDFVVSETDGTWGQAIEIPGLQALGPYAGSGLLAPPLISCASAGNCSVAGCYTATLGMYGYPTDCRPYVADEVGGTWQPAIALPDFTGLGTVTSISCASAGSCGAIGGSADYGTFVVNEVGGTWGVPIEIPGLPQSTSSGQTGIDLMLDCQ